MSSRRILFVSLRMGRIFALLLLRCLFAVHAAAQQDQNTWHILIEPAFMHPQVSFPISGARRTVLVPGYMSDGDPQYFSKERLGRHGPHLGRLPRPRAAKCHREKNQRRPDPRP